MKESNVERVMLSDMSVVEIETIEVSVRVKTENVKDVELYYHAKGFEYDGMKYCPEKGIEYTIMYFRVRV